MNFYDLVRKTRTTRKFQQHKALEKIDIEYLIDCGRLSPSAANLQPLKYYYTNDYEINGQIFENLAWAGYLNDWPGPDEGQRPAGYIIVCQDTAISKNPIDLGFAVQNIVLAAADKGIGSCIILSFKKEPVAKIVNPELDYQLKLVIALGYPDEEVIIEDVENNDIKYWRDEDNVFHVPKRILDTIIHEIKK